MSLQSEVILPGHRSVEDVLALLQPFSDGPVIARQMHRDTYRLVEVRTLSGAIEALHLFLASSVADDYRGVFEGPSTFVTAQFSPEAWRMIEWLASSTGGLARRTASEQWEHIEA